MQPTIENDVDRLEEEFNEISNRCEKLESIRQDVENIRLVVAQENAPEKNYAETFPSFVNILRKLPDVTQKELHSPLDNLAQEMEKSAGECKVPSPDGTKELLVSLIDLLIGSTNVFPFATKQ